MDTTARQPWLGISGWRQWTLEGGLYLLVAISVLLLPPWPPRPELAALAVAITGGSLFLRRRYPASALVLGALGVGAVGIPLAYAAGRRIGPLYKLLAAALGHFAVAAAVSPLYGESVVSS